MVRVVWMRIALIGLAVAIAAGAFGAHGLDAWVSAERMAVWETAVRYQAYAMLALLALSVAPIDGSSRAVWAFVLGTLVFSGSLYLLVLLDFSRLGAVTPIGGFLMIGSLLWLAVTARAPG